MRWFRFYDDALNDPKILKLPDSLFRFWVGILCIASKNDGKIPCVEDVALLVRSKLEKTQANLNKLVELGLLDQKEGGAEPHNWAGRQFKSDTSTERVKRFRNVSSTVSETAPETEQIQSRTDKKDIRAVAVATRPEEPFENLWKVYPKRDGANPKAPARKKFFAIVKSGTDPAAIIAAASRYCAEAKSKQQFNTPYVAQMVTWLNQERFNDYPALTVVSSTGPPMPPDPSMPSDAELRAYYERKRARLEQDRTPQAEGVLSEGDRAGGAAGTNGIHRQAGNG